MTTISYVWNFPKFDVAPSEDGLTNVVKTVHWQYKGTDDDNVNFSSMLYGTVDLPPPDSENFIPYEDLTFEWTVTIVGLLLPLSDMELKLAELILAQQNPEIVEMEPPFE